MRQVVGIKTLVLGLDGFLGWTLAQHLGVAGHEVSGADNFYRRSWVAEMDSHTMIPIESMAVRQQALKEVHGIDIDFQVGDLNNYVFMKRLIERTQPDTIVNFAHQPSAPYSMQSPQHAVFTQTNNITNNLNVLWAIREVNPKIRLVSLGTMGCYSTPEIDIGEGFFDIEYRGRKDTLPFPHQPFSYYHASKSHEFINMNFARKIWNLGITDIMQGVVYGTRIDTMTDPRLRTRFDGDHCFGTVINRFCCQAIIGHPLTVYGKIGEMNRGYIALRDSMKCLELAIDNPSELGEYRVFNQFDETHKVTELAQIVKDAGKKHGIDVQIQHIENPRFEKEKHYYNPDHEKLRKLGFRPTMTLPEELAIMLKDLKQHRERIESKKEAIMPKIKWR